LPQREKHKRNLIMHGICTPCEKVIELKLKDFP
jgi:hypothetical protein